MIVFRGDIASKNMRRQIKHTSTLVGLALLAVCGVVCLIYLILLLTGTFNWDDVKEISITSIIAVIIALAVIFFPTSKMHNQIIGRAVLVEIDETRIRCERPYHGLPFVEVSINEVKKVVDYGEFYSIIYTDSAQAIICQKDLLRQGTIEEFESLFEGKIKRRCKKKK